jgi:transcription termination/antitermination protein NusG
MHGHWYVIRSISGQEKKVKTYLDSEIKRLRMENLVQQILIPTEKVFEMRNGKKRSRERSYLPGYIFVQFSEIAFTDAQLQPEIMQAIKDVPGVVGFLGGEKGKVPIPLRDIEINKILGKVDELKDKGEVIDNPFTVGESVKVMDGPFNGFVGLIEEVLDDKKKLKVTVKIFGRNTPIELNYLQVERV